jgi:hypothetical protein
MEKPEESVSKRRQRNKIVDNLYLAQSGISEKWLNLRRKHRIKSKLNAELRTTSASSNRPS